MVEKGDCGDVARWRVFELHILAWCGMEYREAVTSHSPGLPRSGYPGSRDPAARSPTPTGFRREVSIP